MWDIDLNHCERSVGDEHRRGLGEVSLTEVTAAVGGHHTFLQLDRLPHRMAEGMTLPKVGLRGLEVNGLTSLIKMGLIFLSLQ
jgi:hypothetical protein